MPQVLQNISLLPFNTMRLDAQAIKFSYITSLADLHDLPSCTQQDYIILGGGSNMLFTQNPTAWIIKNELKGIELIDETTHHYFVKVGSGEIWHDFVMYCIKQGYAGLENLALIPGTVGAAPMQNIGAYGVEVKDVIISVNTFDLASHSFKSFDTEACGFGYRESIFKRAYKNQLFITDVIFKLDKTPTFHTSYGAIQQELAQMQVTELTTKAVAQAVINIRTSKLPDPKQIGNCGSFFKNPELDTIQYNQLKAHFPNIPGYAINDDITKVPAAWLIEQCGWKGYRHLDYGVHIHQPLVLVNYSKATGSEILQLSETIIASVVDKFGISLEREVQVY